MGWVGSSPTEITIEVNPDDVTSQLALAYRSIGINRVSIGVQSLDNALLSTLSRKHSAQKAIEAIELMADAGFGNITIDLMYDVPHQTPKSFEKTLDQIAQLPITHLSLYNLVIEPHTYYAKIKEKIEPHLPSEQMSSEMIALAVRRIEEMGLRRYEISAFARPGFEALHNSNYWLGKEYIGIGPSAFSFVDGCRFSNVASLEKYCEAMENKTSPIDFEERLPFPNSLLESVAIRLRLLQGIDMRDLPHAPKSLFASFEKLCEQELLEKTDVGFRLTPLGTLFYDDVASEIIA